MAGVCSSYSLTCPGTLTVPKAAANSQVPFHKEASNSSANVPLESCCMVLEPPTFPRIPLLVLWTRFSDSERFASGDSYFLETFIREPPAGYWSCCGQILSLKSRDFTCPGVNLKPREWKPSSLQWGKDSPPHLPGNQARLRLNLELPSCLGSGIR